MIVKRIALVLALVAMVGTVGWGALRMSGSRSRQLVGELLTRVETTDSVVALTFDDGPTPHHTDSVLAILAEHDARATFFMVGQAMERNPDVVRRVLRHGHEIANHSYSHRRMLLMRPSTIRREVDRTDALILQTGQAGRPFMRPPYGRRLVGLPAYLARQGRPVALWDVEPDTYAHKADAVVDYTLEHVRPGSIILLHVEIPARRENRKALPLILEELTARGYRFVTLSELVGER